MPAQISRGSRVYDIDRRQHGTVLKIVTVGFSDHGITRYAVDLDDGRTVFLFSDEMLPAIGRLGPAADDGDGPRAA